MEFQRKSGDCFAQLLNERPRCRCIWQHGAPGNRAPGHGSRFNLFELFCNLLHKFKPIQVKVTSNAGDNFALTPNATYVDEYRQGREDVSSIFQTLMQNVPKLGAAGDREASALAGEDSCSVSPLIPINQVNLGATSSSPSPPSS